MAQYQVSSAWADVIRQGTPLSRISSAWADVIYGNVATTTSQVAASWVDVIRSYEVKTDRAPVSKVTVYVPLFNTHDTQIETAKITTYGVLREIPVTAASTVNTYAVMQGSYTVATKVAAYAVLEGHSPVSKLTSFVVLRRAPPHKRRVVIS